MQISLSVPSTPQPAETGTGGDVLFEEATQAAVVESDSDQLESFDVLIQAALAAMNHPVPPTDSPSLPKAIAPVATGDKAAGDISPVTPSGSGQISGASDAASGIAPYDPVPVEAIDRTAVSEKAVAAANPADAGVVEQTGLDRVVAGDAIDRPTGELPVNQPQPDQVVEEGGAADDVMGVVEEAMESFTPIPASVLALMRADAVTTSVSTGPITPTRPQEVHPPVTITPALEAGTANEVEPAEGDLAAPIPAVEFVAARSTETAEFSNTFGAPTEDDSEILPLESPAPAPEQSLATPNTPSSVSTSSASNNGHDRLPVVAGTREALGAFAIDQIVSRAGRRDDEPVSRIEARIDPPELGRMSIEISKTSEGLSAHLTVDDPSVLALLDQQMREVQQTLEAAGVPMTSFTMSAGSERDAPKQDTRHDDEELNLASTARPARSGGARSTTTSRREIDTTA